MIIFIISVHNVLDICKVIFVLFFGIEGGGRGGRDLAFIIMYISSFVTMGVALTLGTGIGLFIFLVLLCLNRCCVIAFWFCFLLLGDKQIFSFPGFCVLAEE